MIGHFGRRCKSTIARRAEDSIDTMIQYRYGSEFRFGPHHCSEQAVIVVPDDLVELPPNPTTFQPRLTRVPILEQQPCEMSLKEAPQWVARTGFFETYKEEMDAHGSLEQALWLVNPVPKLLRQGETSEFEGLRSAFEQVIINTVESIKTGDPVLRQQIRMGKE